jgi:hypothetical protein
MPCELGTIRGPHCLIQSFYRSDRRDAKSGDEQTAENENEPLAWIPEPGTG